MQKSFSDLKVLDNISFNINEGEAISIIGKSGIGKSVLLKHLNGLIYPDSGIVSIDNRIISRMTFFDLEKGPTIFPSTLPRLEEFLSPIILKIQNSEIMLINSKKYLIIFI